MKTKFDSYTTHSRRKVWRENSLESSDENEGGKFDWHLVGKFGPYLARYRGATLASVLLMLLYTAFNLANPYLIGVAIDQFIGRSDVRGLASIGILLLVVNVLMWQAQYWQVWSMSWAGQQILYHLSSDMFTHLQKLSLGFYDRTQIGRVMSRLQSDIDVLESMLSSGLLSILGSLVSLVGIVGIMLAMNVSLALLSFTVLPVMIAIAALWQRSAQRSFRRTRAAISMVNATLQENISGMRVIQSLVREDRGSSYCVNDCVRGYAGCAGNPPGRRAGCIYPLHQSLLRSHPRTQPAVYAVSALRCGGRAHLSNPGGTR